MSAHTLGVVGAGNMGSGIAQKIATEGFRVVLVDVDEERAARGLAAIDRTLAEAVARRVMTADRAAAARARVQPTTRLEELADADVVIEAVFEDLALKQDVFRRLDVICRPGAILATNTSSFLVAEIASAVQRPSRVLGLHYFYHPAKNHLVEVIAGAATDPDVYRRAWALQEELRKIPIASRDAYGFIVNRFFVVWMMEAVRMLDEGVANAATIDAVAKAAFGIGMGPFELMNVTGIPIAFHASTTIGQGYGLVYGPPESLRRQLELGTLWRLDGAIDASAHDRVVERLLAITFLVAAALVDEGVGTREDTDLGARVGLRWAAGPFELMNRHGTAKALDLVSALASRWNVPVPRSLEEAGRTNSSFPLALVRVEGPSEGGHYVRAGVEGPLEGGRHVPGDAQRASRAGHGGVGGPPEGGRHVPGDAQRASRAGHGGVASGSSRNSQDGIATITIDRPDAMNALNEAVVAQLGEVFRRAARDPDVMGIVIAGAGRSFVAGADIRFFISNIEQGDIDRIARFTEQAQHLLLEIDDCPKPVVARLHGLALGGGVELALACDYIIAAPGASVGFPETGIGIYPGLGGTQRTTRRIGRGLTKWLVATGQIISAEEAQTIGLIDRVVPHEALEATAAELIAEGPVRERQASPVPPSHAPLAAFFDTNDVERIRLGQAETRNDDRLVAAMKAVGTKAPIAVRLAATLVDEGALVQLAEGLRMELAHLHEIFETRDALTGLSSVGRSRPMFEGR
jgi:3-hydroxyacyl-CoA dehydrogenase/enoyl-CoA hydratase/carnithine racemase